MQTTTNYGLKKPEGTDVVNIDDFNTNADTIDAELKKRVTTSDYIRSPGYVVDTGTANAYVVTLNPAPTAYADGMAVTVKIKTTNTGASTLNINGLGAKTILDSHGNALAAGKLKAGLPYTFRYNGTNFILQGEGGEYGTATPEDVLNTKTLGTEQGIKQGTMDLSNLIPDNIKEDVNINGILGTLDIESLGGRRWVSGSTSNYSNELVTITGLNFQPSIAILAYDTTSYYDTIHCFTIVDINRSILQMTEAWTQATCIWKDNPNMLTIRVGNGNTQFATTDIFTDRGGAVSSNSITIPTDNIGQTSYNGVYRYLLFE